MFINKWDIHLFIPPLFSLTTTELLVVSMVLSFTEYHITGMLQNLVLSALTKLHQLGDLNNKHLFISFRGWEIQDQGADIFGIFESSLPVSMNFFSLCPHTAEGSKLLSFIRDLISFKRAPCPWRNHVLLRISFQHINFRRTHSVYSI